jgi:hypothetical protein
VEEAAARLQRRKHQTQSGTYRIGSWQRLVVFQKLVTDKQQLSQKSFVSLLTLSPQTLLPKYFLFVLIYHYSGALWLLF